MKSLKGTFYLILSVLISFIILAGCRQQKTAPSEQLNPITDKYAAVWNGANVAELDAILDSNFIYHSNNLPEVKGLDGIKKVITSTRTAYPDLKLNVEDRLFSENKVASRWHITGTNTGPGDIPPTEKQVDFWGISIINVSNGKLTEEWVAYDRQSVMQQLGFTMIPPSDKEMK
ncbi:MAG: ester cyclase [Ignavibacteriaceae bacterium]